MVLKNKLITALLLLLVLANIITISMYWFGRKKTSQHLIPKQMQFGPPSQFLIKELVLDSIQQSKYLDLVKLHQDQTKDLREKTMAAKDHFFDLIKEPNLIDSVAKNSVSQISMLTAQQDMATLQHFRQVRALCNPQQQQKFDSIIHQMLGIMAQQRPNMPPINNREQRLQDNSKMPPPVNDGQHPPHKDGQRPPPPDKMQPPPDGQRPPPPDGRRPPPPDGQRPPPPNGERPPPDEFPPPPKQ